MTRSTPSIFLAVVIVLVLFAPPSLAQQGDGAWIEPATGLLDDLIAGLRRIGAPVLGLAVVGFALWFAAMGRIDWSRAAAWVIAGALIIFGPTMIVTLFSL